MAKRSLVVLLIFVGIVVSAVAFTRSKSSAPEDTTTVRDAMVSLVPVGKRASAPEFSVTSAEGEALSLRATRGRPLVITFLAAGCASCVPQVRALKTAYKTLRNVDAEILLFDVGGLANDEILDYYRAQLGGGDHAYAADLDGRVARAYRMRYLGQTFVIDPEGRIAYERVDPPARTIVSAVEETIEQG